MSNPRSPPIGVQVAMEGVSKCSWVGVQMPVESASHPQQWLPATKLPFRPAFSRDKSQSHPQSARTALRHPGQAFQKDGEARCI
ncbi:hypothetical protein D3C77_306830 [compost metagenome]|jgi:hypothetical protein